MSLRLTAQQVKTTRQNLDRDAPEPTDGQLQTALDWGEEMLELASVAEPDPASRQGRAFARAVAALAVALNLGLDASRSRTTASAASTKKVEIGPLKIEKAVLDSASAASNTALSAEEWETRAGQWLFAAGILVWRGFPGAAR